MEFYSFQGDVVGIGGTFDEGPRVELVPGDKACRGQATPLVLFSTLGLITIIMDIYRAPSQEPGALTIKINHTIAYMQTHTQMER